MISQSTVCPLGNTSPRCKASSLASCRARARYRCTDMVAVVYPDGKDDSVMLRSLKYLGIWCFSFSNLSSWAARS